MRTGLNQRDFAEQAGVVIDSQSRYETGKTAPSVEYLARIGELGCDSVYVFSGRRLDDAAIDREAGRLLDDYLALPTFMQQTVRSVASTMRDEAAGLAPAPAHTIHSPSGSYRAEIRAPADLPGQEALQQAFEAAILASPGLQGGALARELVLRLPTLLEVASRPMRRDRRADRAADEAPPAGRASDRRESRQGTRR